MTNLKLNPESSKYSACSFELNGQKVEQITSKITPSKTGRFIAIFKRNKKGIITPFDILDPVDFIIITSKGGDNVGNLFFRKWYLQKKELFIKRVKAVIEE